MLHAAIKGLNRLARRHRVKLRQSYIRIAKTAAMMAGRYAHAKKFRRHQRQQLSSRRQRRKRGHAWASAGNLAAGSNGLPHRLAIDVFLRPWLSQQCCSVRPLVGNVDLPISLPRWWSTVRNALPCSLSHRRRRVTMLVLNPPLSENGSPRLMSKRVVWVGIALSRAARSRCPTLRQ